MATYDPIYGAGPGMQVVAGRWAGGGTSATTRETGAGWTIATGAGSGVYTITWDDTDYVETISFVATFGANTVANVDTYRCVVDTDGSSNLITVLTTSEAGTPTDLAANEHLNFVSVHRVHGLSGAGA